MGRGVGKHNKQRVICTGVKRKGRGNSVIRIAFVQKWPEQRRLILKQGNGLCRTFGLPVDCCCQEKYSYYSRTSAYPCLYHRQ